MVMLDGGDNFCCYIKYNRLDYIGYGQLQCWYKVVGNFIGNWMM